MRAWEFDDAGIVIQALLNHRPSTIDPQLWPSAPRADSAAWSPCAPRSRAPWAGGLLPEFAGTSNVPCGTQTAWLRRRICRKMTASLPLFVA